MILVTVGLRDVYGPMVVRLVAAVAVLGAAPVLAQSGITGGRSAVAHASPAPSRSLQDPGTTVWAGVYTEAQAARGEALFSQLCNTCHGEDLQGGGDPNGPPLRGRGFTYRWRNSTVANLFSTIIETMPGNDSGSLSPDLAIDLVSFILASNAMPAGESELETELTRLDEILMVEQP